MRASRAQMKTAKAVVAVEERLSAVEEQLSQIYALQMKTYGALEKLVTMLRPDKPSTAAQALGKPGAPKARTSRKRGGGA